MSTAQVGIFALGDASHGFYEFNRAPGIDPQLLVRAVADLKPPRSTVGGVNMVLGFHPELWSTVAPADAPPNVRAFELDLRGSDGYTMPATQADLFVWFSAASYDVIFDLATSVIEALAGLAKLAREETGWSYRHSRDLTGFEDGTENPSLHVAPDIARIPDGKAGAAGSVLLFQKWEHNSSAWRSLPDAQQEAVIGRTKPESIELGEDTMPANSHVTRTKVHDKDGEEMNVFRRNVPYGTVANHGTLFFGFCAELYPLQKMLEQMAGTDGGPRDALPLYTTPLTDAYYFTPSVHALRAFARPDAE